MNAKPTLVRPRFVSDLDAIVALWIARLSLWNVAAIYQINNSMYSEDLRELLGITPLEVKISKLELRRLLKIRISELEQKPAKRQDALYRNIDMLGDLLNFSPLEKEILGFAALSQQHTLMADVFDSMRSTSLDNLVKLVAIALTAREPEVRRVLRSDSHLMTSRLVTLEHCAIGRGVELQLPVSLRTTLFVAADSLQALMSAFIQPAAKPTLKEEDFAYLDEDSGVLIRYLEGVQHQSEKGINVLIYGPPGTGKTEFVRWLASHLNVPLYEVKAQDDEGQGISGTDRLTFFQLSQSFLQKSPALMLFDEIEDVFPVSGHMSRSYRDRRPVAGKMFINGILENNPVPTIWISNHVGHMDKAVLRRYDYSFEMAIPPVAVRRRILDGHLKRFKIKAETVDYLAQQTKLSPAQVQKAAKVMKWAGRKASERDQVLRHLIDNSMSLLSQTPELNSTVLADPHYCIDFLNADCDLTLLVSHLKAQTERIGAMCFYGPPGTGKTALGHHLARELEMPLIVKRASDILSPYVGETEQKIAAMFKEASEANALLLLDEADSFLTDRKSARNSWEITGVNEMLTQMEQFEGLFICSTNLMDRLDAASLRRFALKIKFDYLKPEQRWQLFLAQAMKFARSQEHEYRSVLNQLTNLTPGDFATIRRQAKLLNIPLTADELLKRLQQECKTKNGSNQRQIGFIHTP
jgi:SpoVK/Ycf46/Vps4 family AAA+-type ATPase